MHGINAIRNPDKMLGTVNKPLFIKTSCASFNAPLRRAAAEGSY
jgi:hypothetical protein